jgi:glycosyltransferase involved in cell wall biosynthesis
MNKNVAFHSNHLGIRGTEVALYDYADYNETILNNTSFIFAKNNNIINDEKVIKKFKDRFNNRVFLYDDFCEVDDILLELDIKYFYAQKAGNNDGKISKVAKNLIHSVFQLYDPHGEIYVYISKWLSTKMNNSCDFIPYIVTLPKNKENMLNELNIPKNSIVFGRHGGNDTFDISFVKEIIIDVVNKRDDIYFLFLNTDKFYEHKQIIYLDCVAKLEDKVKFINSCDALLHARVQGESFGLAISEFLFCNKPVITYFGGVDLNHIEMLNKYGIYYKNKSDIDYIINNFNDIKKYKDYSFLVSDFSPEKVMKKFDELFLK